MMPRDARDVRMVVADGNALKSATEPAEGATPVKELAHRVVNIVAAKANGDPPTVEGVQDIVEMVLQAAGEFEAAKRYILYRFEHSKQRDDRPIPEDVRAAFAASDQ